MTSEVQPSITTSESTQNAQFQWDLAAESITVRIRWFGVIVGYVLVNFSSTSIGDRPLLNAILTLGAIYALIDTYWSIKGKVFLDQHPLVISLLEAIFIGLLCYFDTGLLSPFRYFYFLSLLVCAIRHAPQITYITFTFHCLSFSSLALPLGDHVPSRNEITTLFIMLVLLGWVTWGGTSLSGLMKATSKRLAALNDALRHNQAELEQRISDRTSELQESQALLVQQEKQAAFGLLAAGIAHEVGNPLAAISSLVQMLNRRDADEYTRERLQMVDDQLLRIQRTLRELVDFSRPATQEFSLHNIHDVIDAALNIAKYYVRRKGKQIVTNYAPDLPLLRTVRDQLVQVFLNLILNALDATGEGGIIEISTHLDDDGLICISVHDDGHGISAKDQPALFQPYFTTKPTGTGLGLFVCKNIVEEFAAGRIELKQSTQAGSTFCVYLQPDSPPKPVSQDS